MKIRKIFWFVLVFVFLNSCMATPRVEQPLELITPTAYPRVEQTLELVSPTAHPRVEQTSELVTPSVHPQPTVTFTNIPTQTPSPTSPPSFLYDCVQVKDSYQIASLTKVIDGDTIEVLIDGQTYRVRYIGVDTPERDDFGYQEAKEFNSSLLGQGEIVLFKDVSETDRYDRLLRYVFVDGVFINYELVRQGYAYAVSYPPDIACQDLFIDGQREAVANQRGLWKNP